VDNGRGQAAATGKTAPAAVSPGKGVGHLLDTRIFVDVKDAGGHVQADTEEDAQRTHGQKRIFHRFLLGSAVSKESLFLGR